MKKIISEIIIVWTVFFIISCFVAVFAMNKISESNEATILEQACLEREINNSTQISKNDMLIPEINRITIQCMKEKREFVISKLTFGVF